MAGLGHSNSGLLPRMRSTPISRTRSPSSKTRLPLALASGPEGTVVDEYPVAPRLKK